MRDKLLEDRWWESNEPACPTESRLTDPLDYGWVWDPQTNQYYFRSGGSRLPVTLPDHGTDSITQELESILSELRGFRAEWLVSCLPPRLIRQLNDATDRLDQWIQDRGQPTTPVAQPSRQPTLPYLTSEDLEIRREHILQWLDSLQDPT